MLRLIEGIGARRALIFTLLESALFLFCRVQNRTKYNGPTIERVQSWPSVNATSRLESRNHQGYGCCDNLRMKTKHSNDYIDAQINNK